MKHNKGHIGETTVGITFHGEDIGLDVEVRSLSNSGIGWYEFWGQKSYDHGVDYADDWEIVKVYDENGEPFAKKDADEIIKKIYDDGEAVEAIQEQVDERLADMMDYPSDEDDAY